MISQLRGHILHIHAQDIELDMGAIVWRIFVPRPDIYHPGQSVHLYTEMIWKETGPTVYGFESSGDILLFNELIKIHSVGPKLALSIMGLPQDLLFKAHQDNEPSILCEIPGVGKKTAQRILSELNWCKIPFKTKNYATAFKAEARQALLSLGFTLRHIEEVLAEYDGHQLDECLRFALGKLGEKRVAHTGV